MNIRINKGLKNDLPGVLELIKELALYEKAPGEVVISLKELEEDGFGPNKLFDFFVAKQEEEIIGLALYYIKYSTWKGRCIYLEDIVVKEAYRGNGVGKKLFENVARVSREQGVRRMEWQVLDWNEPAINFYKKHNAHMDGEWINCQLTEKELMGYGV